MTLNLLKCKDSSTGTKNCPKSSVRNLCPGEPPYLPGTAKPPQFEPINWHRIIYDFLHHLLMFGLGGAVKTSK